MRYIFLIPLLVAVVVISGCTGLSGIFGGNVISVQTRTTEEGVKDPLTITNIMTIPNSPVLPDQEVILSFVLKGNDKIRAIQNVRVNLFDAPGFRSEGSDTAASVICNGNGYPCQPLDENGNEVCSNNHPCTILPGEERMIQFKLLAPSKSQIANIATQVRLNFDVLYDFNSSMNFVIPVVNKDEVIMRQREGQPMNLVFDKSYSTGPMRIDVQPLGVNYILDNYQTILQFSINNVGSGTVNSSQIPAYTTSYTTDLSTGALVANVKGFEVFIPTDLDVTTGGVLDEIFGTTHSVEYINGAPYLQFTNNNRAIQLFKSQSQISLSFPVKMNIDAYTAFKNNQIPFRSYEIKSNVYYTYELRNYADVQIKVFENS